MFTALIDVLSIKILLRLRVSYPLHAAASYIQNQKYGALKPRKDQEQTCVNKWNSIRSSCAISNREKLDMLFNTSMIKMKINSLYHVAN